MFFKRIETPYLAAYSYFIANDEEAVVIDPRRDVDVYLELARKENKKIRYILETHRHEDFIVGSAELSSLTGAEICRSAHEDFGYAQEGRFLKHDETVAFGGLHLVAKHTPGHTKGHLSYVLMENDKPYMVFTGDALFYGDMGRTDFYGEENLEKMTDLAYDSVFNVLGNLGDGVMVMPAHGPGSACGAAIQERPYSTIGYEKAVSPVFQLKDKADFHKRFAVMHFKPPYFSFVEKHNVAGAPFVGKMMNLQPLAMRGLLDAVAGHTIVDVRPISAFSYHHLPKAIFMGNGMLPKALGAFVAADDSLVLVTDDLPAEMVEDYYWTIRRMGYDNVKGLVGDWVHLMMEAGGTILEEQTALSYEDFADMEEEFGLVNVDVREPDEVEDREPPFERMEKPLTSLLSDYPELEGINYVTSCVTGIRALVAASYLRSKGLEGAHIRGNLMQLK